MSKSPGYQRYVAGTYFIFGMIFAQFFHSLWWVAVFGVVVAVRAVYDIAHEDPSLFDDPPTSIFRQPMNWDEDK